MRRTRLVLVTALLISAGPLQSQQPGHPWSATPAGGGTASSEAFRLISSVGQPAAGWGKSEDLTLETGHIPPLLSLSGMATWSTMSVQDGWNLLSVSLLMRTYRKTLLFPDAISPAFEFHGGYVPCDTLRNGNGFWLKFDTAGTAEFSGTALTVDTVAVDSGWNIVGSLAHPVLASDVRALPPVTLLSGFYAFVPGSGYQEQEVLNPGAGFWLKVSGTGRVVFRSGLLLDVPGKSPRLLASKTEKAGAGKVQFTDARGNRRSLFLGTKPGDTNRERFELPPPPPEGIMDVRFRSQRMLELPPTGPGEAGAFPIVIKDVFLPLRVTWDMPPAAPPARMEFIFAEGDPQIADLRGSSEMLIDRPGLLSARAVVGHAGAQCIPDEFSVSQNYPNPFNPSTRISYALPADCHATITVHNLLGQHVRDLVNGWLPAGFHTVEWDGTNESGLAVGSGVYLYTLSAGSYRNTQKAVVLR